LNRKPSKRELQNEEIIKEVTSLHEQGGKHFWLSSNEDKEAQVIEEKLGHKINHKKIYRLMDIAKLECVIHKKKKYKRSIP